jgi:hypothetical protein
MAGFVYIMSNEAFKEGLLKIGMSSSDPTEFRSHDLYTTGVPSPFKVEYFAFVDDHEKIEKIIHKRLEHKRPNYQREFFSCTVSDAIILIRESASIHYEKVLYKSPEEIENEQKRKEWLEKKNQKKLEELATEREQEEKKKREEEEKIKKEREKKLGYKVENFLHKCLKLFAALIAFIFIIWIADRLPAYIGSLFLIAASGFLLVWLTRD